MCCGDLICLVCFVFFFSSRRRHTRCREVSWARRCVQETASSDFSFSSLLQAPAEDEITEPICSENTMPSKLEAGAHLTPAEGSPTKPSKKILVPKLPLKSILPHTHYEQQFIQLVDLINQQLGCDISPEDSQEIIKEKLNQNQSRQQMTFEEGLAVIQEQKKLISCLDKSIKNSLSLLSDFIEENHWTSGPQNSFQDLPHTLNNVLNQIRKSQRIPSATWNAENTSFIQTLKEANLEYSVPTYPSKVSIRVKGKLAHHISHMSKVNAELYEDLMSSLQERHRLQKRLHITTTLYKCFAQKQPRASSSCSRDCHIQHF
eukprot:TRINITY_DN64907_c0_g2_i3.p1 TRINITY_DN64907_c0_g2~~TRINITY_DN64907_c0_g2_i3.p1  ORF type:complete len:318 (-),score=61.41 TRINITY_DN64907_c0_g2_i3:124-1077(-)